MTKPKVFIANPVADYVEEYLRKNTDVIMWDFSKPKKFDAMLDIIKEVDGIIQVGMIVDENLLSKAPKLKVVSNISVGYNNFDVDAMKRYKIIGTHTPGVLDETVADTIMGLIINTGRKLCEADRYTKNGNWGKGEMGRFLGKDIHKATLGIIGMGRIGECVAKRANLGFDMEILYYNRRRNDLAEEKYKAKYLTMDEVIKMSDFVMVMTPLNDETYHLFGQREFSLMRKDAFFINASRGPVVDEVALIKALESGQIAGAGLDVFEVEPIERDNPLLKMDNVVTLPHIGSATQKTRDEMAMFVAKALVDILYGRDSNAIIPELK